jgi:hypothetical protein
VTTSTGRVISVRPLMRPEPHLELLAKAFMQMAIREVQEQAIEQQKVRKRALRVLTRYVIHAGDQQLADAAARQRA